MDPRQLIRTVAVVLAALTLGFLGWRMNANDPEAAAGAGDAAYADVVTDLQRILATYGATAQDVFDHDQVHALEGELAELEVALGEVEQHATSLRTPGGDDAAQLAGLVRLRATGVRLRAEGDHKGSGGVVAMQAFGREAALRAARIGVVLGAVSGSGPGWRAVEAEVARPWPAPNLEGADDAVPG